MVNLNKEPWMKERETALQIINEKEERFCYKSDKFTSKINN